MPSVEEDIAAYYASAVSQLSMDMAGVYVNLPGNSLADTLKGKGLFATRDVEEGELLFCERKLVGCAMKESERQVESCEYCLRPLGTVEEAFARMGKLKALKDKPDNSEMTFSLLLSDQPYKGFVADLVSLRAERFSKEQEDADFVSRNETGGVWPQDDGQWETGRVPCLLGSGSQFCTPQCRDKATQEYLCMLLDNRPQLARSAAVETEEAEEADEAEVQLHVEASEGQSTQAGFAALRKYCRTTNATLLIAVKAVARVASEFSREMQKFVGESELDLACFELRDVAMLVSGERAEDTVRIAAQVAQRRALQPLLVFSQAPWDQQTAHLHVGAAADMGSQQRGMLDSVAELLRPLLIQSQLKVETIIAHRTGVALGLTTAPPVDGPVLATEEDVLAYVNDFAARMSWAEKLRSPLQLVSRAFLSSLMGAFEMNNFGTTARSPVRDYLECCTTAGSADDAEELLEQVSEVALRPEWTDSPLAQAGSSARALKGFLAAAEKSIHKRTGLRRARALERRASSLPEGSGLFAVACCMNHSCRPNVMAGKLGAGRDDLTAFIALSPIKAGEELMVSYIDEEDMDKRERAAALRDYLFVCQCPRCYK